VAVRTLAAALRLDPEGTADLRLVVVGGPAGHPARDPDRLEGLRQLAAEAGVLDRVAFLPPQPQDRLAAFYSAAEVVLVPSRWESFGLVALEAQACGAPVVAAAVGGLRMVVGDGETGFLVPGHDPEEYARRALAILSDPALAARMSARATARAGRFSWEATAADIQSVYRELLAGGGVGR
jgi:D-inositol-3-phosphate glycosyltransferase